MVNVLDCLSCLQCAVGSAIGHRVSDAAPSYTNSACPTEEIGKQIKRKQKRNLESDVQKTVKSSQRMTAISKRLSYQVTVKKLYRT